MRRSSHSDVREQGIHETKIAAGENALHEIREAV